METGIAVHSAISAHHRGDDAEVWLVKNWGEAFTNPPPSGQIDAAMTALRAYLDVADVQPGDQPDRKFRYRVTARNVDILGYMDVCRTNSPEILEFKTTGYPKSWTQEKADLELQATIYAMAYRELVNKSVTPKVTYFVMGINAEPIISSYTTTRSDNDFLAARQEIMDVHDAAGKAQSYVPKCAPSKCPHPSKCAAFGLGEKKERKATGAVWVG